MADYTFQLALLVSFLIVVVGVWYYLKKFYTPKNLEIKRDIPEEVLQQFNEAERRLAETDGEKSPYTILSELSEEGRDTGRTKRRAKADNSSLPTEPRVTTATDDREPEGRQDIPISTTSTDDETDRSDKQLNSDDKRNIFSRIVKRKLGG